MSHYHRISIALAALLLVAPLSAQSAARDSAAVDSVAIAAPTSTISALVAPVSVAPNASLRVASAYDLRLIEATPAPSPLPPFARTSRNTALMIVGGAGMIVGAVVGGRSGTVIMIGGGVIGLIGLWNYLK